MIAKEYKCINTYEKPENPMEWLPCPRCGLRPLVWEFDNGRSTACGCGTDGYCHWSVRAESIMSVIKRYEEIITIKAMSKEYKAIKNYIHNELGLTKEDIINAIRSDIRQYVERCVRNTYGNDNNLERWIRVMVENELQKRDFNVISRMVEKVLRDKMLDNIEIIVRNKDIND